MWESVWLLLLLFCFLFYSQSTLFSCWVQYFHPCCRCPQVPSVSICGQLLVTVFLHRCALPMITLTPAAEGSPDVLHSGHIYFTKFLCFSLLTYLRSFCFIIFRQSVLMWSWLTWAGSIDWAVYLGLCLSCARSQGMGHLTQHRLHCFNSHL